MLKLHVEETELFDEAYQTFVTLEPIDIILEHSLFSMSKWESIHEKPFLSQDNKTSVETFSYIECMIVADEIPEYLTQRLSLDNLARINGYIESKHSATVIYEEQTTRRQKETLTSELIYYWMTAFNIPVEFEHWHLSRLLTLIRICNLKSNKPSKQSKAEMAKKRNELNEQRKAALKTTG